MSKQPVEMKYVGTELEIFQHAVNWKRYWGTKLARYVSGKVCEVGAGIGGSTASLVSPNAQSWTLLEPDREMAELLRNQPPASLGDIPSDVFCGTLADMPDGASFDTITYIDVLEHIENDDIEVAEAFSRLKPGGAIVALSPANMNLYSDFDKSVGHWRRYSRNGFRALFQDHGTIVECGCLDLPGAALSLGNRVLLRQSNPRPDQIAVWDRWIIPIARVLDPLLGFRLGRSVYVVARKPPRAFGLNPDGRFCG